MGPPRQMIRRVVGTSLSTTLDSGVQFVAMDVDSVVVPNTGAAANLVLSSRIIAAKSWRARAFLAPVPILRMHASSSVMVVWARYAALVIFPLE